MRVFPLAMAFGLAVFPLFGDAPLSVTAQATAPVVSFASIDGVETDRSFTPDATFAAWPHVNLKEAQRLQGMHGVVFADARSKVEWDQGHIPGALPVPLGEFDASYKKYEKKFKKARYIVVYCHGPGCHLSDMACKNFHDKGYTNVVNFYQGWPGWSDAKLPTEDREGKITTPPPATAVPVAHP